jgi:predicted transposase YdaD
MKNTTTDIYQVNDSFFHKIFDNPENARDFLERVLPDRLKKQLDLENIKIEDTKYVSNRFKKGFSDIVVKTSLKTKKGKKKPVDIYFIIEHKTEGRVEIFIQVLKYMIFEWEKDYNNNKSPRIIIPVVFYHGADEWKIPRSFAEELKKNVFLFTSMVLMKAAYKQDTEAILEIFKFWYDRGFLENIDIVVYFLEYVSQTQDISRDQLKKMLDDSKIDGGEIMPTLAQQMKEEFREEFKEEFKKEIAKQMLRKGFDLDTIIDITGLEKTEIAMLSPGI